jgi:hypothetical protein
MCFIIVCLYSMQYVMSLLSLLICYCLLQAMFKLILQF